MTATDWSVGTLTMPLGDWLDHVDHYDETAVMSLTLDPNRPSLRRRFVMLDPVTREPVDTDRLVELVRVDVTLDLGCLVVLTDGPAGGHPSMGSPVSLPDSVAELPDLSGTAETEPSAAAPLPGPQLDRLVEVDGWRGRWLRFAWRAVFVIELALDRLTWRAMATRTALVERADR